MVGSHLFVSTPASARVCVSSTEGGPSGLQSVNGATAPRLSSPTMVTALHSCMVWFHVGRPESRTLSGRTAGESVAHGRYDLSIWMLRMAGTRELGVGHRARARPSAKICVRSPAGSAWIESVRRLEDSRV